MWSATLSVYGLKKEVTPLYKNNIRNIYEYCKHKKSAKLKPTDFTGKVIICRLVQSHVALAHPVVFIQCFCVCSKVHAFPHLKRKGLSKPDAGLHTFFISTKVTVCTGEKPGIKKKGKTEIYIISPQLSRL